MSLYLSIRQLLLLVLFILPFLGLGQVNYQTQYSVELPLISGPDYYNMNALGSVFQQNFRLNGKDKKLKHILVEHFFYEQSGWPGPNPMMMLNFYEGTVDDLGPMIYSQPYIREAIDPEISIEKPSSSTQMIPITDSLVLEPNKDYVWELVKPDSIDWWSGGYRILKSTGNDWKTNLGDEGVWFKLLGQATSFTDSTFSITHRDSSNYIVDTLSNYFPYLLLNKYQTESFVCKTSHAGNLDYHTSDTTKLRLEVIEAFPGIKEEIAMVAMDTGLFTVYLVAQGDSVAYFDIHATDRKMLKCSYTYVKYPGESDHHLLSASDQIIAYIADIYSAANIFIDFTDLGIKEYEWDLNNDGNSYDPERLERDSTVAQIPDTSYFSNMVMLRQNKNDSFFGGANGGGTSYGFGPTAAPPRHGVVATHLFRTIQSLGSTLAHELGHNFGLSHYSTFNANDIFVPNDTKNLMRTGRNEDFFYGFQLRAVHDMINYRESLGEHYESRAIPVFFNLQDTSLELNDQTAFLLPVTSNSDASLLFSVLEGDNVLQVKSTGQLVPLAAGIAKVGVFAYATDSYIAASDTITVTLTTSIDPGSIETTGDTICYGGTPREIGSITSATSSCNNITYSWRSSLDNFTDTIPGANQPTYTPPSPYQTVTYRRYAFDSLCYFEPKVSTGEWTITVTSNPYDVSELCSDEPLELSVDQIGDFAPNQLLSDSLLFETCSDWSVTAVANHSSYFQYGNNEIEVILSIPTDTFSCVTNIFLNQASSKLSPPNDTIVDQICHIPQADTLILFNPLDMTDLIHLYPSDSTAGSGTVQTGILLADALSVCGSPDTLYRIWRGTYSDMTHAEAIQRIIVKQDTMAPVTNFGVNLPQENIFSPFGIEHCLDNVILPVEVQTNCDDTDSVSVSIFFDYLQLGNPTALPQVLTGNYPNFNISGVFPLGLHSLEIQIADICGNESVAVLPIDVRAGFEEESLCPPVIIAEASEDGVLFSPDELLIDTFFNIGCSDWEASLNQELFTCEDIGTHNVILTLTNTLDTFECTSTIYINDSTPPDLLCKDTTVYLSGYDAQIVTLDLLGASLGDNCSLTDTLILPEKLSCVDIGDNEIVILAEDASGNIGMCTATITVINEEAPVALCRDLSISLNSEGVAEIVPLDLDNGSYSNCGSLSYTANQLTFSCMSSDVQTVELYVEGTNGKADTCSSTITLSDQDAPNAQCQDITVYLGADGQVVIPPSSLDGGSADNCGTPEWDSTFPSADCDELGTHFALLLVSDAAGNTDVCISEITVADTLGSVITSSITDTTLTLNANCEAIVPDMTGAAVVTGGCAGDAGNLVIGQYPVAGTVLPEDTTVVSLFLENSASDSLQISLFVKPDTIAPDLSVSTLWGTLLQQDTLWVSTIDTSCAISTALELIPSDNCPVADTFTLAVSLTDSFPNTSPEYTLVYDEDSAVYRFELSAEDGWYAFDFSLTDAFGNIDSSSLIISVQDSVPPVAICEDIQVGVTPTQNSTISFADIGINSSDNCGPMDIELSQTQFSCADAGEQLIVLTLTDQFGNTSECTATVTVVNDLEGQPCNDEDECTINDIYTVDCGCAGTLLDTNDNGICDLEEGCTPPTNLDAVVESPTSGTFSWSEVPQAESYRFQYRPIGEDGVSIDVTDNEVLITDFTQGATVQWRVRALCGTENSSFVNGPALNLAVPGTTWSELSGGDEDYQNFSTPVQEASGNPFKLFPNPVRDKAYLVFEQPFSGVVTVSSILGQQLYRITADSQKQLELDLSDWKSSHQLLLITVADGHSAPVTKRVLVAR